MYCGCSLSFPSLSFRAESSSYEALFLRFLFLFMNLKWFFVQILHFDSVFPHFRLHRFSVPLV